MKILVADDDPVSRRCLEAHLLRWGHRVVVACDGPSAWEEMRAPVGPRLAILDWMMPGLDGPEICRRVRCLPEADQVYVILLTSRPSKNDVVAGLESGANDYIVKPFERDELRARLHAAVRIVELQRILADRIHELGAALSRVNQLQGLLPICCYCKKIRDDHNYWRQVESYIEAHSQAQFSHSICPGCLETVVKPELQKHHVQPRSAPGPV
jgi:DNA-binding response OmpR family regulator